MHEDCRNLLELCKMKYIYVTDAKGDVVYLNDIVNLSSCTNIFMEISDERGVIYRIPMKYCIDCGKKLLIEEKAI